VARASSTPDDEADCIFTSPLLLVRSRDEEPLLELEAAELPCFPPLTLFDPDWDRSRSRFTKAKSSSVESSFARRDGEPGDKEVQW